MIRSFKLHIISQLFILLCVYLYANRLMSQYLAFGFIHDKVNIELIALIEDPQTFNTQSTQSKTDFFNNRKFSSLIKCSESQSSNNELCLEFKTNPIKWKTAQTSNSLITKFGEYETKGEKWQIVMRSNGFTDNFVAINESEINLLLKQTWELRDYVLSRILPFMFLLIIIVSLYLSTHIVNIINKVKNIVDSTDIKNLDVIDNNSVVHDEFQPFIDVFNDLRKRLKSSFDQSTRFSSDASHELKTPLTILRGYAERGIKTSTAGSNEQVQFILMTEEIDRLINITDKLLLLARSDAGRLQITLSLINLTELLEELVEDAITISPDLRISKNIQKDVTWECDSQLIHQLIYNLYSNAIKYNIQNGWIHFVLSKNASQLKIEIINSSDNVPKDLPEKAFDRFYRADESHTRRIEGTGLGLSLCKEIAKTHGGTLSIDVNAHQHVSAAFRVTVDSTNMGGDEKNSAPFTAFGNPRL